jgi:hypothetical protein
LSKSIDTLIPDIEILFGGISLNDASLSLFSEQISHNFRSRFNSYGEDRQRGLSLSGVGKPLRKLWFQSRGIKGEPIGPNAKLKFLYGDILEDLLILLAVQAGHVVTDFQKEVSVDGVVGHIDCLIDGVLVDIKSASSHSFNKFADGSIRMDDPFGYVAQLAGYSTALGGVDAAFLVVDKTLGKLTLCRFSAEELNHYGVRSRIAEVRSVLQSDEMPPCCCQPVPEGKSGNEKLPVQGAYCEYKRTCYPNLRTFFYSFGPVFLTKVDKEPKVPELKGDHS